MPNGLTTKQMVDRMYTELLGLNGQSGMISQQAEDHKRLDHLERNAVTKEQCQATREGRVSRRDKVLRAVRELIIVALALLAFLYGSGVLTRGGP